MKKRIAIFLAAALLAAAVFAVPACADGGLFKGLAGAAGAWTETESPEITDELRALLDDAAKDLPGFEFVPVACLGRQIAAGANHCVLCQVKSASSDEAPYYAYVTLYEDPEGRAEITRIMALDIGAMADEGEEYSITIGSGDYLLDECPASARPGEIVKVWILFVTDGDTYVRVNGDQNFGRFVRGAYMFIMPAEDVVIDIWFVSNGLA